MKTKKMNSLLFYLTIFLVACSHLTNSKLLKYPSQKFQLDSNILKTKGYYYCEKEMTAYCKFISGVTSGVIADTNSKFIEKYISAFVLYTDGYTYFTGNLITSGINRTGGTSSTDYCNLVKDYNSFGQARIIFEDHLSKNFIGKSSLNDKGIFNIKGDTILFQIYTSGGPVLFLAEYKGLINNDSTFTLTEESIYDHGKRSRVSKLLDIYHFKSHIKKADSANYLRDNRQKLTK